MAFKKHASLGSTLGPLRTGLMLQLSRHGHEPWLSPMTVVDQCVGHAEGTAGEDDVAQSVMAMVTEIEADEVGASLKWATAKVERVSRRGNGERSSGRERQAERGDDFNDQPP